MNPNLALIFLGVSIGITIVLDIIGIFTNCWIQVGKNCTGIVPFDSSEPAWLAATSWMLFISLGVMVVIIGLYIFIVIEFLKRGYHTNLRKWFISIRISTLLFFFLTVISILVFLPNVGGYKRGDGPYVGINEAGWSCWLIIASLFAIGLVQVFARMVQWHCIAT